MAKDTGLSESGALFDYNRFGRALVSGLLDGLLVFSRYLVDDYLGQVAAHLEDFGTGIDA
jgi:hypothetical protein